MKKIKEFVEDHKKKFIIIGGVSLVIVGGVIYRKGYFKGLNRPLVISYENSEKADKLIEIVTKFKTLGSEIGEAATLEIDREGISLFNNNISKEVMK